MGRRYKAQVADTALSTNQPTNRLTITMDSEEDWGFMGINLRFCVVVFTVNNDQA